LFRRIDDIRTVTHADEQILEARALRSPFSKGTSDGSLKGVLKRKQNEASNRSRFLLLRFMIFNLSVRSSQLLKITGP